MTAYEEGRYATVQDRTPIVVIERNRTVAAGWIFFCLGHIVLYATGTMVEAQNVYHSLPKYRDILN